MLNQEWVKPYSSGEHLNQNAVWMTTANAISTVTLYSVSVLWRLCAPIKHFYKSFVWVLPRTWWDSERKQNTVILLTNITHVIRHKMPNYYGTWTPMGQRQVYSWIHFQGYWKLQIMFSDTRIYPHFIKFAVEELLQITHHFQNRLLSCVLILTAWNEVIMTFPL